MRGALCAEASAIGPAPRPRAGRPTVPTVKGIVTYRYLPLPTVTYRYRPTVPTVKGIELDEYRSSLLERFSNPHIKDTVLRLAEDGSQKLQTTMRPVLLEQVTVGNGR